MLYSLKLSTCVNGPWHNLSESDYQDLMTLREKSDVKSATQIYQMIVQSDITQVQEVAAQNIGLFLRSERSIRLLITSM